MRKKLGKRVKIPSRMGLEEQPPGGKRGGTPTAILWKVNCQKKSPFRQAGKPGKKKKGKGRLALLEGNKESERGTTSHLH